MLDRVQDAIDFALTNGLLKFNADYRVVHAPMALTPYAIGRETLDKMIALTPRFNQLMLKVVADENFLEDHLERVAHTDEFVRELLSIYSVKEVTQPYQLLINRNDYMLTAGPTASSPLQPKQVELNTISVSFPFLSHQLHHLHQFLYTDHPFSKDLVHNDPVSGIAEAIVAAVERYDHPHACVLTIVQPHEQNVFDQRGLEYQLLEKYGIPTVRMSLEAIAKHGLFKGGHLMVKDKVAAVTYFRAGYTPDDFKTPDAWKGRRLIESSSSIKVPNMPMHLAGLKKIQQVLTQPEVLRHFVDEETARHFEATFVGLYSLNEQIHSSDSDSGKEIALEAACRVPENFVLKPQREGGGNNFYDAEMVHKLQSLSEEERHAYILMERIHAQEHQAVLVVQGQAEEASCVSEIGEYGVCLAQGQDVVFNQDVGYLVRTKTADQNEGGVCAGYACLNSLLRLHEYRS